MSKNVMFSGRPIAEALGLPTEGLLSFSLIADLNCHPIIQAVYLVRYSEEGDEITELKKFHLVEEVVE